MRGAFKKTTLPIAVVLILAAAWLTSAGPLTPPAGAVSSTMHTLDEIYNAVNQVNQCGCSWDSQVISTGGSPVVAVPGGTAGVLHAVVLRTTGNSLIYYFQNSTGTAELLELQGTDFNNGGDGSKVLVVDMRFGDGLRISSGGGTPAPFTILYKLD
ncbi:MAG: hypothetical protein HOP29_12085 [Phycisphaerales bacterium]|nr:hypothetical protein [Phycisphaerales bacterium]